MSFTRRNFDAAGPETKYKPIEPRSKLHFGLKTREPLYDLTLSVKAGRFKMNEDRTGIVWKQVDGQKNRVFDDGSLPNAILIARRNIAGSTDLVSFIEEGEAILDIVRDAIEYYREKLARLERQKGTGAPKPTALLEYLEWKRTQVDANDLAEMAQKIRDMKQGCLGIIDPGYGKPVMIRNEFIPPDFAIVFSKELKGFPSITGVLNKQTEFCLTLSEFSQTIREGITAYNQEYQQKSGILDTMLLGRSATVSFSTE